MSEIPIDYYPRVGESKLNRFGDAWRHVKFMLLYSPSWLYFIPGLILLVLGVLGAIALAAGPVTIFGRPWQIHTLFACIAAILLGTQIVQLGVFARAFAAAHLGETDRLIEWARGRITLEHGLALGGIVLLVGLVTLITIFIGWALDGFGALSHEYATAIGFTLVAVGNAGGPRLVLREPAHDADGEPSHHAARARRHHRRRAATGRRLTALRVCLVYDHLYPATVGGGERWMHDLGAALAAAGHEVTYVTMRHWDDAPPVIEGVEIVGLVPAGTVYADGRRSLGPPARFGLAVARYLVRHGHRFDVVHTAAFPFFPMLAAGLARRRAGYRLVADWYEVWTRRYWRRYAGRLVGTVGWLVQRRCVRLRHRAFCISQLTDRRLLEEGFRGEHTVLPGLYAGPVDPTPNTTVEPVVVFAGRHVERSACRCSSRASPSPVAPCPPPARALRRRAQSAASGGGGDPTRPRRCRRVPRPSLPGGGRSSLRTGRVRRERLGARGLWADRRRGGGAAALRASSSPAPRTRAAASTTISP